MCSVETPAATAGCVYTGDAFGADAFELATTIEPGVAQPFGIDAQLQLVDGVTTASASE